MCIWEIKITGEIYLTMCMNAKSLQLCPTLCDPMDCNLPGSSVHRILQARILEWVAMHSSRGSSQPMVELASPVGPALQEYSLPLSVFREMLIKRCVRGNADPELESHMDV